MADVPDPEQSMKTVKGILFGYKGYASAEDMESSDKLLRIESSKALEDVRMKMEGEKTLMGENYMMNLLIKVSNWAKKMIASEGKLRRAADGYRDVVLPQSITPDRLPLLLECDAIIISEARQMQEDMNELHYRVQMAQEAEIIELLGKYDEKADRVGHYVEQRHRILHGGELLGVFVSQATKEAGIKKVAFSGSTICPKCAHYSATTQGNCPRCGTLLDQSLYKPTESAPWSPGMGR